jgi:hypothetical protein
VTKKIVLEVSHSGGISRERTEDATPINTRARHLTIYRAGIQSSRLFPGLQTERELLRRGDLLIVNSTPEGEFDDEDICLAIVPYLRRCYASITFYGSSMGVPVLYKAMLFAKKFTKRLDIPPRITMVLADPIATTDDLAPWMRVGGRAMARLLSGRNLPSWFGEKILFGGSYPEGETLTKEEATLLAQHEHASLHYPPSYWITEFLWLCDFPGPDPRQLEGIDAVALKSKYDDLLRPSAIKAWDIAFGLNGRVLRVLEIMGKAHCDMMQSPRAWADGTTKAYDMLGIPVLQD